MKLILVFFALLSCSFSFAQTVNPRWSDKLEEAVSQFKACESGREPAADSCYGFVGQALRTVYRVNDFYSSKKQRHLRVDEIYDYLRDSQRWVLLGKGYEPKALAEAQSRANKKRAVVAVYLNDAGLGHLAYVLPGQLSPSGSWGMPVPNSAAYFTDDPEKSYVNKGLSYSFPRRLITKVYLYARTY